MNSIAAVFAHTIIHPKTKIFMVCYVSLIFDINFSLIGLPSMHSYTRIWLIFEDKIFVDAQKPPNYRTLVLTPLLECLDLLEFLVSIYN